MSLSISSGSSAIPIRPTTASGDRRQRRRSSNKQGSGGSPQLQQRLLAPPLPIQQQILNNNQQRKRNSFHGFCLPGTPLDSPDSTTCCLCPSLGCAHQQKQQLRQHFISSMLNRANGQSLLQLPRRQPPLPVNGGLRSGMSSASVSPAPSEEELFLSPYCGMIKPKYSLNLRPEDCAGGGGPATPPTRYQRSPQPPSTNSTAKGGARVAALAQANRQQGSTDSAPTSAGISSKKRKEIWAQAGPCSFHQSFDIRTDPLSLSNSCGHIDDVPGSGGGSGGGTGATGAGFRTERRSGFCSGETSRDSKSHPGHALSLFCGAPGCSGHAPCPGVAAGGPHRQHPLRSAHSSFDEGDQSQGHLRDTYLTEISREWMLMNGAITPFKNILQQASSIASTPMANHRPIQSPAGPAAAAAMSTANAILGHNNRAHRGVEEEQHIARAGPYAAGQAIRGSCHNLATVTAAATTSPALFEHLNRSKDSFAGPASSGGGVDSVIIIEPQSKEGGRPTFAVFVRLIMWGIG